MICIDIYDSTNSLVWTNVYLNRDKARYMVQRAKEKVAMASRMRLVVRKDGHRIDPDKV